MKNQTAFLILAAILLTAVVSIALFDSIPAANAQGNMTGGAKNMTGGAANMTKNATGAAAAKVSNATSGMGSASGAGTRGY